jgi:hypothetical protein
MHLASSRKNVRVLLLKNQRLPPDGRLVARRHDDLREPITYLPAAACTIALFLEVFEQPPR